jgi:hypothetical protein
MPIVRIAGRPDPYVGATMADNPKRCFVISPIGEADSVERKHADMTLNAIIRQALNENGVTFDVKRADESVEIGMITDHLIMEILDSDLIVADLSFLNELFDRAEDFTRQVQSELVEAARLHSIAGAIIGELAAAGYDGRSREICVS